MCPIGHYSLCAMYINIVVCSMEVMTLFRVFNDSFMAKSSEKFPHTRISLSLYFRYIRCWLLIVRIK